MTRVLFVAAVILAVFTAVPVFAQCDQGECQIGPCVCFIETGDRTFSETSCPLWQFSNGAARGLSGGDYYGRLGSGNARIKQTLYGGNTNNEIELFVDVDVIIDEPGNERLYIEVLSTSGTLLETLDVINANEASGTRHYYTSGFGGNDVVLQFRRQTAWNDGYTQFHVDNVWFWRCGF